MKCPKCFYIRSVKDGIVKGKQRYKCKRCGYRYTVEARKEGTPLHIKRVALMMYMEGHPLARIADSIGVSHTSIANWLKDDTIQVLINENRNRKGAVRETNKEGLTDALREKVFNRWLLVSWNSLESRTYLAWKDKPWGGRKRKEKKHVATDVDFFRETLNKAFRLADTPTRKNNDEIRNALYTLTWLFDDIVREVHVEVDQ